MRVEDRTGEWTGGCCAGVSKGWCCPRSAYCTGQAFLRHSSEGDFDRSRGCLGSSMLAQCLNVDGRIRRQGMKGRCDTFNQFLPPKTRGKAMPDMGGRQMSDPNRNKILLYHTHALNDGNAHVSRTTTSPAGPVRRSRRRFCSGRSPSPPPRRLRFECET